MKNLIMKITWIISLLLGNYVFSIILSLLSNILLINNELIFLYNSSIIHIILSIIIWIIIKNIFFSDNELKKVFWIKNDTSENKEIY